MEPSALCMQGRRNAAGLQSELIQKKERDTYTSLSKPPVCCRSPFNWMFRDGGGADSNRILRIHVTCVRQRNERGCLICVCCISRPAPRERFLSFCFFLSAYVNLHASRPGINHGTFLCCTCNNYTRTRLSGICEFVFCTRTAALNNVSVIMTLNPSAESQ